MIVRRRVGSILKSVPARSLSSPPGLLLWLAAWVLLSPARLTALPADRTVAQYVRHSWTVEQGLPHGTVRGVTQTADGYLWMATYEGLVRFNGEKFHILDKSNNPGIPSNSITILARTKDDTLWLGTLGGLVRYRAGQFQTITTQSGADMINALVAARDGSVWAGTAGGKLTHIVNDRLLPLSLPLPAGPITALAPAGDSLWIGTTRGLAREIAGRLESWTTARGLASDTIVTLLPDGDDAILVGTAAGLDRIEQGRVEHIAGLPVDQVTALRRDRDGNLWIGTYSNGLFRMTGRQLAPYTMSDGLLNLTVRAIFEDDEGSLWIGSNGGLEQLRAGAFVNWNKRDGLSDSFARVIFEDRAGMLWVGTANGLNIWEGGGWKTVDDHRLARILSMEQGRDGTRWFGTASGVFKVAAGETTLFTTVQGLSNNTVRAIHEDARGDVWIATDFGLNRIRAGDRVESFAGQGGLGTDYAMSIAETPDGRVWVATGGGLAEFDGRGFKLHSAPGQLPSNRLFALAADPDGTIWIATDGEGLLRYRDGRATAITSRHGLGNDKILSIADDAHGNLWFGTVRGAFRSSKRDLNAVADGAGTRLEAKMFDENDGLGSRQCNGVANPAVLRSGDGRIWFATANGISVLTSNRAPLLPARNPAIESVAVDGKEVSAQTLRAIPPGVERIEFNFTGVTFATPERLRLRYRLAGYDAGWVEAGTNHVASYTNLRAGDYRFLVASSRDGAQWRTAELPFTLRPHFYETQWFIALCVLAVVALLLTLHSVRLHFTRERARLLETLVEDRTHQISEEKERTEEALASAEAARREAEAATREAERHERLTEEALAQAETANRTKSIFLATTSHELRTPLNAIIGFSEILLSRVASQLDQRHARFLQNIHSSGLYLLGHINNILDLSKIEAGRIEIQPELILLREVADEICTVMRGVATLRSIDIELVIPEDLPLEADATQIKQILYNLMSNAVKFSPERSTVTVAARHLYAAGPLSGQAVEIRVTDQGIGIDPSEHELIFQEFRQAHGPHGERPAGTGLGLALVKRFVEMHGGTIRVESEHGSGSTFVVMLPSRYRSGAASEESLSEDVVGKV
jgi:signal transduction histidine kinase/ligand-binding sensor domain-containing protein